MLVEPPRPFPALRTNPPDELSYSKYLLVRSCSKSSQKIQAACGVAHSLTTGPPDVAVTVRPADPDFPSLVAVIWVDPAANAVTAPVDETEATDAVVEDQVIVRPVRVLPPASFSVAVACVA